MRDIHTDEQFVELLDELCFHLKPLKTPMGLTFRKCLHKFIEKNGLDSDPHNFTTLPKDNK